MVVIVIISCSIKLIQRVDDVDVKFFVHLFASRDGNYSIKSKIVFVSENTAF